MYTSYQNRSFVDRDNLNGKKNYSIDFKDDGLNQYS